ncbi:hypothetical protein ZWY2020_016210 [Hordeum vulgare]|nr:hypothetical protein ZWY2020_016210 [Hordeum vulgare]
MAPPSSPPSAAALSRGSSTPTHPPSPDLIAPHVPTTHSLPLPSPSPVGGVRSRSRPPPPSPPASDAGQGLLQLSMVLASLGYNEMASEAPLLDLSPPLARWPGAITVFAAPDAFLQASCPMCSCRDLLEQRIAMGYYPYSELTATATMKIPSASIDFCIQEQFRTVATCWCDEKEDPLVELWRREE